MKFKCGVSGNPAGRPRGSKDRRTALRELLLPHAQDLVNRVVELAKSGDTAALRIVIDRLIAPIKATHDPVVLRPLGEGLSTQGRNVLEAMAAGRLSPDQAVTVMQAITAQVRIVQVDELEKRVRALEEGTSDEQTARAAY